MIGNISSKYLFEPSFQGLSRCIPITDSLKPIVKRVFKNPFFWAVCLSGAGLGVCALSAAVLPASAAIGVSVVVFITFATTSFFQSRQNKNWIFSEGSLLLSTVFSWGATDLSKRPWNTEILPRLTLGACPLKIDGKIPKEKRPHAVLSMVEAFETKPHLLGVPVKPWEWRAAGVKFLNLPTPDCTPVKSKDVREGVEFLHKHLSKGRRVLVHCLAGVGRSATVLVCYLMKYQGMTAKQAVAFVRSKRLITVDENSVSIRKFAKKL